VRRGSVIYVETDEKAAAVAEKIANERLIARTQAIPGFVISLVGLLFSAGLIAYELLRGISLKVIAWDAGYAPYAALALMWIGGWWMVMVRRQATAWFLIGPFVLLLPSRPIPMVVVGEAPDLIEDP
jgi:hypothetical protein